MLDNKIKTFFILIIIVILFFLFSYFLFNFNNLDNKVGDCDDECIYENLIKKSDQLSCFNITDPNLRITCYNSINERNILKKSIVENNISICSLFNDSGLQENCINNFYLAKSVNLKNKIYCENLTLERYKNECYNR